MARKRIDLGPDADARIVALMARGGTAETIAAALSTGGRTISPRTAQRRMGELRGRERTERAARIEARQGQAPGAPTAVVEVPLGEVPDTVPEDAPLELVDKWIAKVEAAAEAAEGEGDLRTFATLAAKLVTLLEHRRKAAPPPVADPNEHPDMVQLAADVRARLHRMIEQVG